MRKVVAAEFDFVWRVLRRLGVEGIDVDDAAQEAFIVASKGISLVPAEKTRSYLFAIALRIAAQKRRAQKRKHDRFGDESLGDLRDTSPGPDELLDERRAREVMDEMLECIPLEQRAVFVLFEMEDMTTLQISELLDIPVGTVASRLRRARELYFEAVKRHRVRAARRGT